MTLLVQISDPHFGTEQAPVVAALTRLVHQLSPELVVLSGDITQRATRRQFAAAQRFVNELGAVHVLAIPGNHDIPLFDPFARFLHPYANYRRAFGSALEPRFETPDLLVLGVNTTRPARHKHGEISTAQIDAVAAQLQRATPLQLRVVVTHQPVHVIRKQDFTNLLRGHEAAVRAWSSAGVDIIMGGHIHLPHVRPLRERFLDLPRAVWSVQAGTAVSTRIRDNVPNSINVLRCSPTPPMTCEIERWDFASTAGQFARVTAETLQPDRSDA